MADKLHIPGPDGHQDLTELDVGIVSAWAVCMLLCIGLFIFFRGRMPEAPPPLPDDPAAAEQQKLFERAQRIRGNFDRDDWPEDDVVAVFRHGPREAAEAACETLSAQLEGATLSHRVHLELLKSVDRRARHAPWTCLLRRHLADEIDPGLELDEELAEFWGEVQRFEASSEVVETVLTEFRRSRKRPETANFYAWLRLCAVHPHYEAREECLKILYQLSPDQGADILAAVDLHLEERAPEALERDVEVLVPGLGRLARQGQPDAWQVAPNDGLASYDRKLRLGAVFQLCRFLNSPTKEVVHLAAEQLSEAGRVSARAADKNLVPRWRRACKLAFRDQDELAATDQPAAALAVWSGQPDEPPRYSMAYAVESQDCPDAGPQKPAWHCALELWQGGDQDLDRALMGFFTETRHIEWVDQ